jgi:hypothetical protein
VTVAAVPDRYGECAHCDHPDGDIICEACGKDEVSIWMREWLVRAKTVAPGLTNAETAIVERLIQDLEAS